MTGPCAFEHKGEAECEAEFDDFHHRGAQSEECFELMLYINVGDTSAPATTRLPTTSLSA